MRSRSFQNLARENQYIKEISTILENATCGVIYLMRDALTLNYVNRTALEMLQYKREDFFRLPIRDMFPPACIGSAAGQQSTKK